MKLYQQLCMLRGVSGDEAAVAQYIAEQLKGSCEVKIDPLGSVIARAKGQKTPKHKIGLFAHMDEVGLMITSVTEEGLLKFASIGIDAAVLHGRAVVIGERKIPGVIGCKAYHHLSESERNSPTKVEELFITIGAESKQEALSYVSLGDTAVFDEEFCCFGQEKLLSKALDDRLGCGLLIELLQSELPCDLRAVFTTLEETGMQGAAAAAYTADVDIAIVLENTTAGDICDAGADKRVCSLGKGPVVSFMDKGTLYDRKLYQMAFEEAERLGIPIQTKEGVFGSNDAKAVIKSRGGVRVMAISIPCRYLHSASGVVSLLDIQDTAKLLRAILARLADA